MRNMGHSLDDFLLRCRENIAKITVDEYERIIGQFRTLMVDEQKELQEIHKTAIREANVIKNALESGADTEEARKNLRELNEINKNLDMTITEQLQAIKKHCEEYCKFKEKENAGAISARTFEEICKECPISQI